MAVSRPASYDAEPAFSLGEGLRPVIILGAARSGTKFLRALLAASRACRVVAYGVSPVWRYGNHRYPDDALPPDRCTARIARQIRKDLRRLASPASHEPAMYLVEKSSANTLRLPFVAAVLPDARYIHLVRDGRDVVASAYQRWTAPVDPVYLIKKLRVLSPSSIGFAFWYLHNLVRGRLRGTRGPAIWGPRYPGIEADVATLPTLTVCAKQWRACVEATLRDLDSIPPERLLAIRYEDLVTDADVMASVAAFLGLPDAEAVLAAYHRTVRKDRIGAWQQVLSREDLDSIRPYLEPTMQRLAYDFTYA